MTPDRILPRSQATFAVIEAARRDGLKAYLVGKRVVLSPKKRAPGWCLISVPVSDPKEAA